MIAAINSILRQLYINNKQLSTWFSNFFHFKKQHFYFKKVTKITTSPFTKSIFSSRCFWTSFFKTTSITHLLLKEITFFTNIVTAWNKIIRLVPFCNTKIKIYLPFPAWITVFFLRPSPCSCYASLYIDYTIDRK